MRRLIARLPFRALIYVAAVFVALAATAIGFTVWQLRVDAIDDAAKENSNVAAVLAEQVDASVQAVDRALREVQQRIEEMNATSEAGFRLQASGETVQLFLKQWSELLPQVDVMFLLDDRGELLNSSTANAERLDLSSRDFFEYFKYFGSDNLYVSAPALNQEAGPSTIYFSKRLDGPGKRLFGVVVIGVQSSYFRHIYTSISKLSDRSFFLTRSDGTILIGHSEAAAAEGNSMPLSSPWYSVLLKGGGYYRGLVQSQADPWLVSVKPVHNFPLVVNIGVSEGAALATWRSRASFIGFGSLLAMICLGLLFWALSSQFERVHQSEALLTLQKTALAEQSRALEIANIKLDNAINNMSQGLSMYDADGRLVLCNGLYQRMSGLAPEDVAAGIGFRDVLHRRKRFGAGLDNEPDTLFTWFTARVKDGKPIQTIARLDDGRIFLVTNRPLPGGGWVGTHEDITERKAAEAQIAHMARHDALTDLPNRLHLTERLEAALKRLRRHGEHFSVFIFDLDRFKAVNDSLGHPVGDALLKAVAQRLRDCTRPDRDTVARLGGDEFAILQPVHAADQKEAAVSLASRLLQTIGANYQLDGHDVTVGASIGIAMAPQHGDCASALLKNADLALYKVKMDGRDGFEFFEPEMDAAARSRGELQVDLRRALANNEFELYYQPIFSIVGKRACGIETLLRWRHPQRGMIGPDKFIPLAEETGLIVPIGEWVLRKACHEVASWPSHLRLAVNLSSVQFNKGRLVDVVSSALAESGMPPERLDLEITESVLLQDHFDVVTAMHQLRSLGVQLVLDDFGTGYSSLSNLQKFPFDKIKIDKSFVDGLATRSESAAIVSSLVGLGKALNITITAEGVETQEQLMLLRAAGCDEAQGFLLGRPAPLAELAELMGRHANRASQVA